MKKLEWRGFTGEDNYSYAGAVGDNKLIGEFEMLSEEVRKLFSNSGMTEDMTEDMIEVCKSEGSDETILVTAIWAMDDSDRYYGTLEFNGYGGLALVGNPYEILESVNSGKFDFLVDYFC